MLHDLLFALLGKPGSFVRQQNNSPFYIDESLNLFSNPEVVVLNQLVNIGYHYQQIDIFLHNQQDKQSAFIKAVCHGIDLVLNDYRGLIMKIESDYLNEKMFIVSQLTIKLAPFQQILMNLHTSINIIGQHSLKGGQIIDYLQERTLTGNEMMNGIYSSILKCCYQVLYQQLNSWMLYGQILDNFEEFFIQRIDENKSHQGVEYNWESSFTLNVSMIPLHIISVQAAERILFIGKAVKVLKGQQEFYIPDNVSQIEELKQYDSFIFNKIIDEVYRAKGQSLVQIILNTSELFKHLTNLSQFLLINNGNFFQTFLEESQQILSLPQTQHALQELNFNIQKSELEWGDKLELFMYNNGFDYKNFSTLSNLQIKNNVIQTVSILRMGPSRVQTDWSGIYRDVKQSVENGFTLQIVFKFKQFMSKQLQGYSILQTDQQSATSLVLVFCTDTNEDSAVYVRAQLDASKISSIQIEIKCRQQIEILYKWRLDKIDFSEGDLHSLKISYQNDELSLILDDVQQSEAICKADILPPSTWVRVPFKFQKYIQLELGRCVIGIKSYGQVIDLCSWKMIGSHFLNEAQWSGLTLKYQIDYPLSLLITPALQEKFQLFFRYLFPIRYVQYELQQVWVRLLKKQKQNSSRQQCGLHNQLMHVVNAFYSYFQTDIVSVQWCRMIEKLKSDGQNFEQMKKTLNDFEQSVSNQLFLNLQQIVKQIFQIMKYAHKFIELTQRLNYEKQMDVNQECYKLKVEFDEQFMGLYNLITLLTKSTNQTALFQLLTRLDYNGYFIQKNNDYHN